MPTRYRSTMRARDEDRTHTCSTLDAGLAEGQLTDEEHTSRVAQAMKAATLGDLHALIADLQGDTELAPVRPVTRLAPVTNKGPVRVIGTAVLASIVAVIVVIATQPGSASTDNSGKPDMFASGSFEKFTADLRAKFGDAAVDTLVVYPHYVVLDRAVAGAPRLSNHIYYDGEFDEQTQSPGRTVDTRPTDLAAVDTSVLAGLLAGASSSANVANPSGMYYTLGFDDGVDTPTLSFHVSNDAGESGSFDADLHGNFTAVHAFDPTR